MAIFRRMFIGAIALILCSIFLSFALEPPRGNGGNFANREFGESVVYRASANRRPAPPPVAWEWRENDLQNIKRALKKIKTNADGSFAFESAAWRVTTYLTPLFTAQAGVYMDRFADVFFRAFLLKSPSRWRDYKPQMIIYANRDDYLRNSGADEWSDGICRFEFSRGEIEITIFAYADNHDREKNPNLPYLPSPKTAYRKLTAELLPSHDHKKNSDPQFILAAPLSTIQHEATHALLLCLYGTSRIPMWLNEGAADYYGEWQPQRKISRGGNVDADIDARRARQEQSSMPEYLRAYYANPERDIPRLRDLIAADTPEIFYAEESRILNYNLAESFIDFLMTSKNRRPFFLKILERVQNSQTPPITDDEIAEYEKPWLEFLIRNYEITFTAAQKRRYVQAQKTAAPKKNANPRR